MKLTDLLDQIDRLDQQATKGPWIIDSIESGEHALFVDEDNPGYGHLGAASSTVASFLLANNADFIAHARESLPQLAKALRAVLAKCASMDRGVGSRDTGQHDTWDSYHEGMSDMAGYIEEAITDTIGDDDEGPNDDR